MAAPLKSLGLWRAQEGAIEITVPLTLTGFSWWLAYRFLAAPAVGRPFTDLELGVLLGVCAAVTGWASSRQMFLLRRRRPWVLVLFTWFYLSIVTAMFPSFVRGGFESKCTEDLLGVLDESEPLLGADGGAVCRVGGVERNPYLPGRIYRPTWDASWSPWLLAFMAFTGAAGTLGFRDRRTRGSKMAARLHSALQLAPSAGAATAAGKPKVADGRVQACVNATFWGEICGQLYSADKEFFDGEWCVRCHQVFQKADREVTFKVVTLFTADVDVLNGLERTDTVSWDQGEPMIPDARISGAERWVTLGQITLPDVITVAQALSLIHEQVPKWAGKGDPQMKFAAKLVKTRASRVSAWIWTGRVSHRLTYATPTRQVALAIGPNRLRDIINDTGDEMTFQLDVGLLPVEMRVGFKKTFDEEGRLPEVQNSKVSIWLPVSPSKAAKKSLGVWVPRVEGKALQTWLSTERKLTEQNKSGSEPLPYYPFLLPEEEEEERELLKRQRIQSGEMVLAVQFGDRTFGEVTLPLEPTRPQALAAAWILLAYQASGQEAATLTWDAIRDGARSLLEIEPGEPIDWVGAIHNARRRVAGSGLLPEIDEIHGIYIRDQAVRFLQEPPHGSLDLIRIPLDRNESEPTMIRAIGDSIAEWEWLEWEQIQLLRQQCLVMIENQGDRA